VADKQATNHSYLRWYQWLYSYEHGCRKKIVYLPSPCCTRPNC